MTSFRINLIEAKTSDIIEAETAMDALVALLKDSAANWSHGLHMVEIVADDCAPTTYVVGIDDIDGEPYVTVDGDEVEL